MEKTKFAVMAEKYQTEALESLKEDIKINSIYDEKTATKENPFGLGVRKALDYIADLGKKLGFQIDYCDHYATELSYGKGPLIDIYAHQDVVPVSPHWATDPFYPTIKDDVMYARGAADDKGPGISCLYGAKLCMDQGLLDGVRLRFVFGGNEERGSLCLEHYFHKMKKGYPAYGFSPDADYPLIFAEKGIYSYEVAYNFPCDDFMEFSLGDATNIVLGEAKVEVKDAGVFKHIVDNYGKEHKGVKATMEGNFLHVFGQAVHGSTPWLGVNAGLHMLNILGLALNKPELCDIFRFYEKGNGIPFGGGYTSKYFDSSSYCVGVMSYDGRKLKLIVNMRLPENVEAERAVANVKAITKPDSIKLLGGSPYLVMDPESPFIQSLLKAYQEETGDYKSKPEAIGGGTYARDSKNSVAFGMQFPGVDCQMHQDGEFLRLKDFRQSIAIYAHAIASLAEMARKEGKK